MFRSNLNATFLRRFTVIAKDYPQLKNVATMTGTIATHLTNLKKCLAEHYPNIWSSIIDNKILSTSTASKTSMFQNAVDDKSAQQIVKHLDAHLQLHFPQKVREIQRQMLVKHYNLPPEANIQEVTLPAGAQVISFRQHSHSILGGVVMHPNNFLHQIFVMERVKKGEQLVTFVADKEVQALEVKLSVTTDADLDIKESVTFMLLDPKHLSPEQTLTAVKNISRL